MSKISREKNALFCTKIKKIGDSSNSSASTPKSKIEHKSKFSNSSLSKKHLSFKDLMEKAKNNDISKPAINEVADFREAKKALKNSSGRKKHKDDFDDDSEDERSSLKKKANKKESHSKSSPVVKKSKKELLNEQMEKRKREKEKNLKAYDGIKDRVAQERLNILKSRGVYRPVTSKISQEVTEMVKRMENNRNNNNSNNNNKNNQNSSSLHKSSSTSELNKLKMRNDNRHDGYDSSSRKHSRYDDESDDYDSEYERRRRHMGKYNFIIF